MKLLLALSGLFALGALSGCTNAVSPQTAQSPPSVSTPAPVAVVTAAPSKAATPLSAAATTTPTPTPSATTVAAALAMPGSSADTAPSDNGGPPSFSKEVASLAAQIRGASTEEEAKKHAFASQGTASELGDKIKQDPSKAAIYSHWQTAMRHLSAAATFKANSFHAWNDLDAKSKLLSMSSELTAAQSEADTTQRLIDGGKR